MTFDMTGEPKYENFLQEQFYPCLIPVLKLTMMLLPMIKMMATTLNHDEDDEDDVYDDDDYDDDDEEHFPFPSGVPAIKIVGVAPV